MAEKSSSHPATSDDVLEQMQSVIEHSSNASGSDDKPAERSAPAQQRPQDGGEKKPSKVKELWTKTGLDV